jgi:hypothetical protein
VALVLTALAAGALAALAVGSGRALVTARHDAFAITLALASLDTLRSGPRADGADAVPAPDGASFARAWTVRRGRGRPDALDVETTWPGHRLDLATEAMP